MLQKAEIPVTKMQELPGGTWNGQIMDKTMSTDGGGKPWLSVSDIDELQKLNRLYRSMWWIVLAANLGLLLLISMRAEAVSAGVPPPPVRSQDQASFLIPLLLITYRITLVWVFVALAQRAKRWWGLGKSGTILAALVGTVYPLVLALSAGLRMQVMVGCLKLDGGFFGIPEDHLRSLRKLAVKAEARASNSAMTDSQPQCEARCPSKSVAWNASASDWYDQRLPGAESQRPVLAEPWLAALDSKCSEFGHGTRWHHFHPEALAYGIVRDMPPEEFVRVGYSRRLADLQPEERAAGEALSAEIQKRAAAMRAAS